MLVGAPSFPFFLWTSFLNFNLHLFILLRPHCTEYSHCFNDGRIIFHQKCHHVAAPPTGAKKQSSRLFIVPRNNDTLRSLSHLNISYDIMSPQQFTKAALPWLTASSSTQHIFERFAWYKSRGWMKRMETAAPWIGTHIWGMSCSSMKQELNKQPLADFVFLSLSSACFQTRLEMACLAEWWNLYIVCM